MVHTMTFEIYFETYSNAERKIVQKPIGISSGISFSEACCSFARSNAAFAAGFNERSLTYKGKELYGNLMK